MSEAVFRACSGYYDLIYADKDYAAEANYVSAILAQNGVTGGSLLEFGSGSGGHGHPLAEKGFEVIGVERSPEMVEIAKKRSAPLMGSFHCEVGDIRSVRLGRKFNSIVALFHVVSYQTNNNDIRSVFATAREHLRTGGLFFFDVWHGPAVLTQRPSLRLKRMENDKVSLLRVAEPEIDTNRNLVTVHYTLMVEDLSSGRLHKVKESHVMRYFSTPEIDLVADEAGFQNVLSEEFFTGLAPSDSTWGVAYLLRKRD